MKHKLAAFLLDAPRYAFVLRSPNLARRFGRSWVDLHNRGERLVRRHDQRGVGFDWRWSSRLFYCQAYPQVARLLLRRALTDWPIRLLDQPEFGATAQPLVSFVIGHRGRDRVPHLLATLRSIAGQVDCPAECVVVEQSAESELDGQLPTWVRHVHLPLAYGGMPYSRAWSFNVGARVARAPFLVLHDNDLWAPAGYAREVASLLSGAFDVARLQRFVFYLNESDTARVFEQQHALATLRPEVVLQNNQGGTIAIRREVFFALGGYDEGFVGWGGEDNEFFERCRTRRLHDCAYLPFLHLYHPPQPGKGAVHANVAYFESRTRIPELERIAELKRRGFGKSCGPVLPTETEQSQESAVQACAEMPSLSPYESIDRSHAPIGYKLRRRHSAPASSRETDGSAKEHRIVVSARTISRFLRHKIAANLLDKPRYALRLSWPRLAARLGNSWLHLCNRHERLVGRPNQRGVVCDWLWCSSLYHCENYPETGRRLLECCLRDWPITFVEAPAVTGLPDVSFIIGHRGTARLPHLLATLGSIAAQQEACTECIVVEQASTAEVAAALPGWVRHVHTPPPRPDMPYSRSWAFNVGAREARGPILVFHDNDVCVPARYAAELVEVFQRGFEAARLQRFLFCLSEEHTHQLFTGERGQEPSAGTTQRVLPTIGSCPIAIRPPLRVMQNCEGHTLAVQRDVYFDLGGHDESFVGWGGEDNEFFERCRTRRLHDCAYLPFLHLYHPPQPGKGSVHPNVAYFESRTRIPELERIAELKRRGFGKSCGPVLTTETEQSQKSAVQACAEMRGSITL